MEFQWYHTCLDILLLFLRQDAVKQGLIAADQVL